MCTTNKIGKISQKSYLSYIKKINGVAISMQTNNVTGKIMILQKIRKKNH
jgi:hypothetical protein